VPIHGWVFEPEEDDLLRKATQAAIREALGLDAAAAESSVLRNRLSWFLVDNERVKKVPIRIGDSQQLFGPSDPQGHFTGTMEIPVETAKRIAANGVLTLEALSPAHPPGTFMGRALLVGPAGTSVISDIDDTIKISEVTDKKKLVRNTFLEEFRAAPGMPELYRRWANEGASVHFVSSSPWQLYPALDQFRADAGFPEATFELKRFRLKDSSVFDLLADPRETKPPAIEAILEAYPGRRFCLVGDSGEKDPEVYGEVARKHPDRIACIYLRNVTSEAPDSERMRAALRDVDPGRWALFTDPKDLKLPKP
jgi:phosphatidate phosphatase APP1